MKKGTVLLLSLLCILTLSACATAGSGRDASAPTESSGGTASAPQESYDDAANGLDHGTTDLVMPESEIYSDPDAKLIRTAQLTIQTTDFDQSVTALAQLTEANGGYYETAQVNSGGYYDQYARRSAYYVVRIPRENFIAFRDAVGEVGHIHSFTEDAQNVGEEYYDTEARLETLTTKRERLLALLDQAEVMEDIISLEDALAEVQYEIDQHTTTLRKYDSLINYSTFTIHLDEVLKIEQEPGPQESYGTRLLANLKDGLAGFGAGMQALSFWLARNLIVLIIVAAVAVAVVFCFIRHRRKRRNIGD